VLLDAQRTATDDPKSKASRRTISAEEVQLETVALQRTSRARQAADRLKAGAGYTETGLVFLRPPEKGVRSAASAHGAALAQAQMK